MVSLLSASALAPVANGGPHAAEAKFGSVGRGRSRIPLLRTRVSGMVCSRAQGTDRGRGHSLET